MNRVLFFTACDAEYFALCMDLIASLKHAVPADIPRMRILDVGLHPQQSAELRKQVEAVIEPGWDLGQRGSYPTWFRAMTSRPFLPNYASDAEIIVWIDSDAWIQCWHPLDNLIRAASGGELAIVEEQFGAGFAARVEAPTGPVIHRFTADTIKAQQRHYYEVSFGPEIAAAYGNLPPFNSGVFALRADSPTWATWRDVLASAAVLHPLVEQQALCIAIRQGRVPVVLQELEANFVCAHELPWFDPSNRRFTLPKKKDAPLGIVHLTVAKQFARLPIPTFPNGDVLQMSLLFRDLQRVEHHQQGPLQNVSPTPSTELASAFNQALALHQAGRLAEAEKNYLQVLKAQPNHFDSLRLLGAIYHQRGDHAEAIRQYDAALKINPKAASALSNRGVALLELKRFDEALASYDEAIALKPDYAEAFNNRGVALQELKRFGEALASYDQAITFKPDHAEALYNRGNALRELKRFDEALASYDRAIALKPDRANAFNNRGAALRELKRFDEAVASFDKALALKPDYAEAFNNRGAALQELKRFDEALASYDKALALKSDYVDAFNNRGVVLRELGRLDEAVASYDQALALKSDYAEAFYNRGAALHELKRFDEAVASYDKALALKPDHAEAFYDRGTALHELKRFDEALASYDKALALKPDHVAAFNNRGVALRELKRLDEALASYDQALVLKPDCAEAFYNSGAALQELKRFEEALASYDKAIAFKPDHAEAFYYRGNVLQELRRLNDASASYHQAIALKPHFAEAQFALCMAELPILYENEPEIIVRRKAYQRRLRALCDAGDRSTNLTDLAKGVGSSQPFFLAYQGYNDRDLQALYGSFVCRVMAKCYPPAALAPPPGQTEPVRVGIVSGFFWQHTVWKLLIKGWLSQLDRRRFRIFGYHTGVLKDSETEAAIAMCDRFVQGPLPIDRWRTEISADAPHVLIYPEVGMDHISAQLAAQRLALVQCKSWGHPDTSGFPTLDYYLSSDLMEPPDGQDHYTERLVRLPNLSIYYEPLDAQSVSIARQDLGLRSTAVVYWCGQSLFKYLPQFDEVFPRIARAVGDCQFAFIQYQNGAHITELFRQRLNRAFAASGLRADDHCVFLPRLDQHVFVAATGQCDVFLDSINWSGGNTTLESLVHDLPIVTMTGPLMRGRHSTAILRMMGVTETITETIDDYVYIAIRLARDVSWRQTVKAKISARKHRIYRDRTCISGLEQFLNDVVRRSAPQQFSRRNNNLPADRSEVG